MGRVIQFPRAARVATQNQDFSQESQRNPSWCKVRKDEFPHKRTCVHCGDDLVVGQYAVTLPLFKLGELEGTLCAHAKCVRRFLDDVPEDKASKAEQQYAEIRALHSQTTD